MLWWFLAPIGVTLAGYFPGRRLGAVGDLPAKVMWQWRQWCLHPGYLAAEGPLITERYARVRQAIQVVLAEDDELVSPEGIRRLYELYSNAEVRFHEIRPRAMGLRSVGHFGLFKPAAKDALWPQALAWIDPR